MWTGRGLWMFVLTHLHTYETHRPANSANSECARKLTIGSQPSANFELRSVARGTLILTTLAHGIQMRFGEQWQTIALLRAIYNLPRGFDARASSRNGGIETHDNCDYGKTHTQNR